MEANAADAAAALAMLARTAATGPGAGRDLLEFPHNARFEETIQGMSKEDLARLIAVLGIASAADGLKWFVQFPAFAKVVAPAIERVAAIKTLKVTNTAAWECKTSTSQVRVLYLDFINSAKTSSVTQGEVSSGHPPWAVL